jgi:hypothetical protein
MALNKGNNKITELRKEGNRVLIWGRATMGEKRLCGLAMFHILRDFNVNLLGIRY